MSSRLSKILSVHTYVMPRTVYFGWICTLKFIILPWLKNFCMTPILLVLIESLMEFNIFTTMHWGPSSSSNCINLSTIISKKIPSPRSLTPLDSRANLTFMWRGRDVRPIVLNLLKVLLISVLATSPLFERRDALEMNMFVWPPIGISCPKNSRYSSLNLFEISICMRSVLKVCKKIHCYWLSNYSWCILKQKITLKVWLFHSA